MSKGREIEENTTPSEKLKGKEYERELGKLHVEARQASGVGQHTGAKVCIVFEGRDGAGKGGMIKAITEGSARASFG